MNFSILGMKVDDLPAIVALEKLMFSDPWSYESFEDGISFARSGGCVAKADPESGFQTPLDGIDTRIIGYACYYSAGGETHLTNIAVLPELRRKKIAQALLEAVFAEAVAVDSDAVFLEVRESNTAARRLYEGHGFVELYTRKAYYNNPREDAIVYVCELKPADDSSEETH